MTADEALTKIITEYNAKVSAKPKVVVIAGPTASGKTTLAIKAANALGGEIVSCDSMQLYKYMDIGTAKPTPEEQSSAVHHMIDFLEPWEEYSSADFCKKAKEVMKDIISRGKVPVLSGGTGLYISSLTDNIEFAESDPREKELTDLYVKMSEEKGIESVYSVLCEEDPEAAEAIHINNKKRVIRAVVLLKMTGMKQKERNILSKSGENEFEYMTYVLNPDREILYSRIDLRVDLMIRDGLEQEVRNVLAKCREAYENGLSSSPLPGKTAYQAIGYKEFADFFEGSATLEETVEKIKLGSRRYAKRQLTWLRRMTGAEWLEIEYESPVKSEK